jgi:prepilin-type processing-associated H-X9-DG protein
MKIGQDSRQPRPCQGTPPASVAARNHSVGPPRQPRDRSALAFTLTELVVVLAVLGTLAVLHLAAATTPKDRSASAVCQNNLRQLTAAWLLYAQDNQDRLPGNFDGGDVMNVANTNRAWCVGWLDFAGGVPSGANTNLNYLRYSQLGRYLHGDVTVFKCPADSSVSVYGSNTYPRVRSVSMNSYMGERSGPYTSGYQQFRTLSSVVRPSPSGAFVFIDEREDSINDDCLMIDMSSYDPQNPNLDILVDLPADYHEGGATLSFVDGHVETWHWRDPRTTPPHLRGVLISLGNSTPNNPDVERIQAAGSRKISNPTR